MTTMTRPEAGAGARPPAASPRSRSRFANWRGSWAVALRMARREVRRHRGRSFISLLMVSVPTALLSFALTIYPTSEITGAERIPYELGNATARIDQPGTSAVVQNPDATNSFSTSSTGQDGTPPAKPLPGWSEDSTTEQTAAALTAYFGGTIRLVTTTQTRVLVGDRSRMIQILATPKPAAFGDNVRLVSGRWPTKADEVVATQPAIDAGLLPTSGTITLDDERESKATVVGVAEARDSWGQPLEGIIATQTFGAPTDRYMTQFFLDRDAPVTWAEVKEANSHGITVLSAEVLRNPPTEAELDPAISEWQDQQEAEMLGLVVAGGAILLIIVTLLVGPAFAVGAARQRRTLAIAASNGATTSQLRRTVLSQAVVLGALAALVGAVVGVLAVPVATNWVIPIWTSWGFGPLDVPWLQVLGVMAVAMASALVAAMIPAQRLGRLDIVGVMKGQNVSPPPSRVLFLLGLVGAILGGIALFWAITTRQGEGIVVGGAILLIVGSLLLVPVLLTLAARLARHFPVALRMATRDAARQRTRSAPSVAAVVGAVAALTMMGVGLTSDTEQQLRDYVPQTIEGEATVWYDSYNDASGSARESLIQDIRRIGPQLVIVPFTQVASQNGPTSDPTARYSFVNYRPAGCTTEQTVLGNPNEVYDEQTQTDGPKCQQFGTNAMRNYGNIGAVDLAELDRRFRLTDAEKAVLSGGGAIAFRAKPLPATITIVDGTSRLDAQGMSQDIVEKSTHDLRVVTRPLDKSTGPLLPHMMGMLVTTETAKALGWPTTVSALGLYDPNGAISTDTEERLNAAMGRDAGISVERGFQRQDALVMGILVGIFAFLILVITLTSTALSMAEQQRDDATLAAVGATRRTRRAMAAAQATVIAGIGALLGLAVGLVPGIAIAYPLTGTATCDQFTNLCDGAFVDPIIEIPWLWLGLVVVAVPLVAALMSAIAVRREPQMTRRTT